APGTARPSPSPKPPAEPASAAADPSRRQALLRAPPLLALTVTPLFPALARAEGSAVPDLKFATTPSGLQVADVKVGSASSPSPTDGQVVSVDYVMSTTGARYGSKIYSTVDAGAPYRWTLGDGSTIPGLEEAVRGMKPGGVRRAIIPAKLAYQAATADAREECVSGKGLGPVPPASEAVGEFQRFKNIYCNPDRVYQPDLVMDVKLYGKR
ncbi:hypothetical protein ACHAWF_014331, partial [Thalassiosira exigua]